ncbi:hypothetical protein ACROYT_G031958 [Oculina patagonica]
MDGLLGWVDVRKVEGSELFLFMYWYHQPPWPVPNNRVSRSSRRERMILNELLNELLNDPLITVQYLKLRPNKSSTKVSHPQGSYRIDSQTPYAYYDHTRDIANLQYQFTNRKTNRQDTYANTVIKYKPSIVVPADLSYQLINERAVEIDDPEYGFTNADIKRLFHAAMQQSAEHQSINRMCWVIISLDPQKKKNPSWRYRSKCAIMELKTSLSGVRGVEQYITQVENIFKNGGNSEDPNIIFPMPVSASNSSALRKATTRGAETVLKEISLDGLRVVGLLRAAEIRFRKSDYFGALCEVVAAAASMVPFYVFYGRAISFTITTGLLYRDISARDEFSQRSELGTEA